MGHPHAGLLLVALFLILSACSKSPSQESLAPSFMDCKEDVDCFVARASTCAPSSVLLRRQVEIAGSPVRTAMRYEVVGKVQGRCHLRHTRVEPPPTPIRELRDPFAADAIPQDEDPPAQKVLDERIPPRLQCLYLGAQAAEAMRGFAEGRPTSDDLEPCYPGDGRCGPVPLLVPGCALGDCLLGRWTYTCESRGGRDIFQCEGTRLSDTPSPDKVCSSWCGPDGREQVKCRQRKPGERPYSPFPVPW